MESSRLVFSRVGALALGPSPLFLACPLEFGSTLVTFVAAVGAVATMAPVEPVLGVPSVKQIAPAAPGQQVPPEIAVDLVGTGLSDDPVWTVTSTHARERLGSENSIYARPPEEAVMARAETAR